MAECTQGQEPMESRNYSGHGPRSNAFQFLLAYVPEVGPPCGFPVEAGAGSSREAAATLPCVRSSANFAIS
jgi:hypothetical protein